MTKSVRDQVKESLMQGYLVVNKKIVKKLGGIEALFLSYLIDKESYWKSKGKLTEEGWFFKNSLEIEQELDIGESVRKKIYNRLLDLGLIEMKKMGTPCKWHYRICWSKLGEFLGQLDESEDSDSAIYDSYRDEDILDGDDQELSPNGAQKQPSSSPINKAYPTPRNQASGYHRSASDTQELGSLEAREIVPLLPKTEEINLHHPLTPSQARGKGGSDGQGDLDKMSVVGNPRPTIDQIRRSWERSFLSDSLPAQQDRLPLLRDLMATLRSHDYTEYDLPRNMMDTVTAHWWSKAKDKKVKESLRERSLKDYDLALGDLSDPVEITPAKSMLRNMQKRPKETHEAGSMSLDAFFDLVDQGALDETDDFYEQMCRLADQSEREEEAK